MNPKNIPKCSAIIHRLDQSRENNLKRYIAAKLPSAVPLYGCIMKGSQLSSYFQLPIRVMHFACNVSNYL